jgi:hypothetical protein
MPVQNETDTATFMIWASPNFSVQIPFGKGYLSSTFKYNFSIGVDVTMKTQTNWTLDVAFNYMFGSKIRLSPKDIIGDMWISDNDKLGAVYNAAGENSKALSYEGRYWYFGATLGKMISIDRWKNSGLWLKLGAGYFGHKIYFADSYNLFPQIDQKTYRLGYDQRAHGIAFNQFFGYMFMQKRRVLSFYFGVELWEIFTKPDRGYIFVGQYVGPTDPLPKKFSGLLGVKLGWILPFYEKNRVVTYYYF